MKIIKKVFIILLIISVCNLIPCVLSTVNAATIVNDAIKNADNFLNKGNNQTQIISSEGLHTVLNTIYGLLLFVAITYAVIKGMLIGIKIVYGTIEEKVDAKAMIIPYLWIVGAIAFGGVLLKAILNLILSVF